MTCLYCVTLLITRDAHFTWIGPMMDLLQTNSFALGWRFIFFYQDISSVGYYGRSNGNFMANTWIFLNGIPWKVLVYTTFGQREMSQIFQVLEIFKTWICHILEFFWLPKVTSILRKRPVEHDGVVIYGGIYSSIWR